MNVDVFDMVAEDHKVDVYTLEPQLNEVTKESCLHAVHFPTKEGASKGNCRGDP